MSESSQEPNPLVASESDSMLYELQPQARLYGQPSPRSHPSSARMQIKLNIDPSGSETDNEDVQSNTQQEDKSISKEPCRISMQIWLQNIFLTKCMSGIALLLLYTIQLALTKKHNTNHI